MSTAKKIFRIAKKTAWGIFLGFFGLVAVVALWLTIEKFIMKSPVPSIFGFSTLTVETGSMQSILEEESIDPGDMILIRRQNEYKVGEVITFLHEGDKIPTTHRIIGMHEDGGFKTKGDANNTSDPEGVSEDIILGKVIYKFKGAGVFATWVRTEGWIYITACFAILGLGLFILSSDEDEDEPEKDTETAESEGVSDSSEADQNQDPNTEN